MHKNPKLGEIITETQQRDAIHVAVAPMIAGAMLKPGAHIKIEDGVALPVKSGAPSVGVVDPFLRSPVDEGETFWIMLHPGSITSLRHEWTHPAFEAAVRVMSESEKWIRAFCETGANGLSYAEILDAASNYEANGEYLCHGGRFEGLYVPDEFWPHYRNVSGTTGDAKGNFFTCSC